jgi:hypothetical protein
MVDAVWRLPLDEALASEVRFSPHEQLYLEYRQGLIKEGQGSSIGQGGPGIPLAATIPATELPIT